MSWPFGSNVSDNLDRFGQFPSFETTTETTTEPPAIRGTLTLTSLGPVLGCPMDLGTDERDALRDRVDAWRMSRDMVTLVLPFPVDVVDLTK